MSMRALLIFVVTMFGIACCSSVPKESSDGRTGTSANNIPFRIVLEQQRNRLMVFITARSVLHRFDPLAQEYGKANDVEVTIMDARGNALLGELYGLVPGWDETGVPGEVIASLMARSKWNAPDSMLKTFSGTVHIKARSVKHEVIYDTVVAYQFDSTACSPLRLTMTIDQHSMESYSMNMSVYRVRRADNLYLPTTLSHDWAILNDAGQTIWQQSYGMMYGQVIATVMPTDVGKQVFYTDEWDGKGNIIPGTAVPGHYRVVGIIPSKPTAISDTMDFFVR